MGATLVLSAGGPTRWGGARVDLLIVSIFYVPILALWAWHRLSKRGDDGLGLVLFAILFIAGFAFATVQATAGAPQAVAITVAAGLCAVSVGLHVHSTRRRKASGELGAPPPRRRPTGWRLWWRIGAAGVCVVSAIMLTTGSVRARGASENSARMDCGSISDALSHGDEDRCAAEARIHIFGVVVVLAGGCVLVMQVLRGKRRYDVDDAQQAKKNAPQAVEATTGSGSEHRQGGRGVLASFGLIVLAQILLVIGRITSGGLPLIFLSIALSAAGAVVLWVTVRRSRAHE